MRKLKALLLAAALLLSSCASAPRMGDLSLLDLLSPEAALYVSLPVAAYQDLAGRILLSSLEGLSEKDAGRIVSRTQAVFASIGLKGDIELAASGSYPQAALHAALSEKKGWEKRPVTGSSGSYSYFAQKPAAGAGSSAVSGRGVEIAFPQAGFACISGNVAPMVQRYEAALQGAWAGGALPPGWEADDYRWLLEASGDEIRFAAPDPSIFLSILLGTKANVGIKKLYGSIRRTVNEKNCALSVTLEVSDPRTIKAVAASVKLAIFPVAAEIRIKDSSHIQITEYTMPWKKLYSLMGI